MPRSAAQSDFVVSAPPLAEDGEPGELPHAQLRSNEASARATKWVMTATFVMLAILVLMCAIGPHIPAGE